MGWAGECVVAVCSRGQLLLLPVPATKKPTRSDQLQDLPFFSRLSPGELMARTSGDSLTLRTLVATTAFQVGHFDVRPAGILA